MLLLPTFLEFEVELPTATKYLLSFYSRFFVSIVAFIVLLLLFLLPSNARSRFKWGAVIAGAICGIVCLVVVLVPLMSLWNDLR